MAKMINLYEPRPRFPRLVEETAAGEEIITCKGLGSDRHAARPGPACRRRAVRDPGLAER